MQVNFNCIHTKVNWHSTIKVVTNVRASNYQFDSNLTIKKKEKEKEAFHGSAFLCNVKIKHFLNCNTL